MSVNKLELAGSLSVTQASLSDMSTALENQTISLQEADVNRDNTTFTLGSYSAFIKVTTDINGSISHHASDTDSGEDDAWSMAAFSFAHNDTGLSFELGLPSASNVAVDAGNITASDGLSSQQYNVTCTMSVSDQGVLTCSTALTGADLIGVLAEDVNTAQKAYWPINDGTNDYSSTGPSAPDADTGVDVLTATITASALSTHYATALAAINTAYNNTNLVTAWSISVSAVTQSTTSSLSNFARSLNKTDNNIFSENDEIVCATPYSFAVDVQDASGSSQTIISAADVHGVLVQSA